MCLWQFFWLLSDNTRLVQLTNDCQKQKLLQNASYFVRKCDVLEQMRYYFWNQHPIISIGFHSAIMMQGTVIFVLIYNLQNIFLQCFIRAFQGCVDVILMEGRGYL